MATEVKIPEIGEGVESVQLTKMLVQQGDSIKVDQSIAELETGKAVVEVPSPADGKVAEIKLENGSDVKPGDVILTLEDGKPAESKHPETSGSKPQRVPASPSVRRLARELGVNINEVKGSGPRGRVSREDVKKHVHGSSSPSSKTRSEAPPPALPDFANWGEVRTEKMTSIRRQTAKHLSTCWMQIPHVTIHDKADITELEPLRKKYAELAEKEGGKLTMAVMITKIAASALKRFPKMNASVDMNNGKVIFKEYCHMGIAIATERGLVVPVIRNADKKNMVELAAEISAVAQKARDGKLEPSDMEGGTFTVTNLGRIGGEYFTPIINHPEVGILGMGRYAIESDPDGGSPRTFLPLSLSFDHRLVDGADGAEFLAWIIKTLKEPMLLSIEG
ncbi:MAG: 2-oxo acid dehydrogenase subunit E2 [Lentisphaeria bacterium]